MSLSLSNICYAYPNATTPVLHQLNLHVPSGTITGLTAPSGAGKSTLLHVAGLMLQPSSGHVTITGSRVPARVPAAVRRKLGVIPQSPRAHADPRLTLAATICAPAAYRDGRLRPQSTRYRDLVNQLCKEVQLPLELLEHTPRQVSDGQLQRALLARALVLNPSVLIADEPTAQLDRATTDAILAALQSRAQEGAAVLIASHDDKSLRRICDHIVELEKLQERRQYGLNEQRMS